MNPIINDSKKAVQIKAALSAAFKATIPVFASAYILGVAYGVIMQSKGYNVFWSTLMSTVAFCGSMQFAAIPLLTSAFNPLQAFLLSVMVNARHLFYSISMLERYRGIGKIRYFLIYVLSDESFSISYALNDDKINRKYYYISVSSFVALYWIGGTFTGGLLGQVIPFDTTGLDFALTALFAAMLFDQIKNNQTRKAAVAGTLCTLVCLIAFGKGSFMIPAMALMLVIFLGGRKRSCF